jgi:SAM-dependent methyltransferase
MRKKAALGGDPVRVYRAVSAYSEANRAMWDERVPIHVEGEFYDLAGFAQGKSSNLPFEVEELGDVTGRSLVHLQCHIGKDTLSWARRGASVSGLDFSEPAIEAARELARRIGVEAAFVVGDLYDAPEALGHRTFDIVYTGRGALNWLPDIERWAQVAASLVAPGGVLYVSEFHPFTHVFGDDDLTVAYAYFHDEPVVWDEPGTYADMTAKTVNNRCYEWNHGIGAVVTAIIDAGLQVELLHEHEITEFQRWPMLVLGEDGRYRLPDGTPSMPLMYSLLARRPA